MTCNIKKPDAVGVRCINRLYKRILKEAVFFLVASVMLFCISAQAWANPATVNKTSVAAETFLSNIVRMRVVWVQDIGDGRDVDTVGSNLRLMGLDTGDGKGERAILTTGNYAKPLITPRGDRVVFSDRIRKKVVVENWDG